MGLVHGHGHIGHGAPRVGRVEHYGDHGALPGGDGVGDGGASARSAERIKEGPKIHSGGGFLHRIACEVATGATVPRVESVMVRLGVAWAPC